MPESKLPYALVAPATIVVFAMTIYPTITSIYLSFTSESANGSRSLSGLTQYRRLIHDGIFWHSLWVTVLFVGGALVFELTLGLGMALLLHQRFLGRGLVRSLVIVPIATTPIAAALGWRIIYNTLYGVLNYIFMSLHLPLVDWLGSTSMALPSVLIIDIWQWTPFVALILLAGLTQIPDDLYEAARLDGARERHVFRYVTLPFLAPVALVALVFRGLDAIRTFDTIYATTGGGPGYTTETVNIYAFHTAFQYGDLSYAAAIALVVLLFSVVPVSLLYKRMFEPKALEAA